MSCARRSLPEFLRRVFATGGAALVFALGMFAASPDLHHWLHDADGTAVEDGCAVVLFANGVSAPLGPLAVAPPSTDWHEPPRAFVEDILLTPARYLRQPERGPPVG